MKNIFTEKKKIYNEKKENTETTTKITRITLAGWLNGYRQYDCSCKIHIVGTATTSAAGGGKQEQQ